MPKAATNHSAKDEPKAGNGKKRSISIARRIRRAMVVLALSLSVIFSCLTMLLMYVIEDKVFMHQLRAEQQALEMLGSDDRLNWQPKNRYMQYYQTPADLPELLRQKIGSKPGIYEYFDEDIAAFILLGADPVSRASYFIVYDVSDQLAVRQSRSGLIITIVVTSLIMLTIAVFMAIILARQTLNPLRELTQRLQAQDDDGLSPGFSSAFKGDEVGVLAEQLEQALERVKEASQREFEFNRGVSHELRSPIQVAKSAAEILALNEQGSPLQDRASQRLQRAITQMEHIVEAFLWLASEREVGEASVDAKACIENIIDDLQRAYPGCTVELSAPGQDKLVYAMPTPVFAVAVGNLLRNALQHSVSQSLQCVLSTRSIVITNPMDSEQNLPGGFGIGLLIVQKICQRFDWSLSLSPDESHNMVATIEL